MSIRLAVVGAGLIAHSNVLAAIATGDFEIAAICNRTLSKAEAFRDKYGLTCPVFQDYRAMADAAEFDAVLIQTPHDLHAEQFCFFAEKGKDVVIEKPLAHDLASARRIVETVRRTGIRATVCHTQRYNPLLITAKRFLEEHDCGKLVSADDAITYHYFWDGRPQWFVEGDRAGGGIVMNYGVHQLDRLHFITGGQCGSLFAHLETEKEGFDVDSSYHITCIGTDGAVWHATSTGYTNPFSNRIELRFTKGILRIVLVKNALENPGVYWGDTEHDFREIPNVCPGANFYQLEMQAAADYLLGRADKPPISVEYAARMVELVELAKRSAKENQVVSAE